MAEALVADFGGQVACGLNGCWLPLPAAFLFPAKSANSPFRQFAIPPICSSATSHRDPTTGWLRVRSCATVDARDMYILFCRYASDAWRLMW